MAGKVTMQFSADDARAITKIKDLEKHLAALENKAKQTGNASKNAGKANKWMRGTIGDLKSMAAGYVGVQGAIQLATRALQHFREEQERAKEARSGTFESYGQLLQLANGDTKKYEQLVKQANQLRGTYGMSQEMAGALTFDLDSGGESQNTELFGSLYGAVKDTSAIAKGVIKAKRGFGTDETGSSRSLINKFNEAAVKDVATIEDISSEIARVSAASGKSGIGASDEETLAVLSTLITNLQNAEAGGVRTNRLAQFFAKEGIQGGFVSGLTDKRFAGLTGQKLIEAIPEIRAREGFIQARNNLQEIMAKTQRIDAAGRADAGSDNVMKMVDIKNKVMGDEIEKRAALERLKIDEERELGEGANRRAAAAARGRQRLVNRNFDDRFVGGIATSAAESLPLPEEVVENAGALAANFANNGRYGNSVFAMLKSIRDLLAEKSPSRQPAVGGI